MPGVRWGSFRWRKRHAQRSQIIALADSAKTICRSRFPLSFATSNCHCHAVNPLARATGAVSAAATRFIVCGLQHRWIASPDREEIKRHTDDEQRDRKMNDYRVLCVFR